MCDESIISSQSEARRGTLYQKPGPPTPSKNGGRLSFGGGSIAGRVSFGEVPSVLKDQNCMAGGSSGRRSIGPATLPRKASPTGKLKSMFSSSKNKDEVCVYFYIFIYGFVFCQNLMLNRVYL